MTVKAPSSSSSSSTTIYVYVAAKEVRQLFLELGYGVNVNKDGWITIGKVEIPAELQNGSNWNPPQDGNKHNDLLNETIIDYILRNIE